MRRADAQQPLQHGLQPVERHGEPQSHALGLGEVERLFGEALGLAVVALGLGGGRGDRRGGDRARQRRVFVAGRGAALGQGLVAARQGQ